MMWFWFDIACISLILVPSLVKVITEAVTKPRLEIEKLKTQRAHDEMLTERLKALKYEGVTPEIISSLGVPGR